MPIFSPAGPKAVTAAENSIAGSGTRRKRPENIFAGDNPSQSMVVAEHGDAPDTVFDHELQHPRQPGVGTNVDEFGYHDIGDSSAHQLTVSRDHLVGCKGETLQQIELGYNAGNLPVLFDRIGVEIITFEHAAQFTHVKFARHCLDGARHVTGDGFLEKSVHGAILSVDV